MTEIRQLATPKGNGYQATVSFPDGVFFNSAESYPTIREAWPQRRIAEVKRRSMLADTRLSRNGMTASVQVFGRRDDGLTTR